MARELIIYDYVPTVRVDLAENRWGYNRDATRMPEAKHAELRAKIEGAYLGPWCPVCGKKGAPCPAKKREACRLRAILSGKKPTPCATLPEPPLPWLVTRGYVSAGRHRGGYVTTGFDKFDRRAAAQQYAYEVAMGRDAVAVDPIVGAVAA